VSERAGLEVSEVLDWSGVMGEQRKRLEESARVLRVRLSDLQRKRVSEHERPMHEVALAAVRTALTDVGQQLTRIAG
tara:strand:- start:125 stop:355 length:231 start_codon:yes stop_codon:yes gene_type:complete